MESSHNRSKADQSSQKSFMVATLVSTLIGTFTAAAVLHDKYEEKKDRYKQKKIDQGQTDNIDELRKEVKQLKEKHENDDDDSDSSRDKGGRSRSRRKRIAYRDDDSDGFDREAALSKRAIQQEFDANMARLGTRFAQGDVIAENKLQAQIIALQQTVIDVLQDAMISGRTLGRDDMQRLIAAQESAKQGSLDAMRDQYQRMNVSDGRRRSMAPDVDYRRQLTLPSPVVDSGYEDFGPPRRVRTAPVNSSRSADSSSDSTYCKYALDLQSDSRAPILSVFSPGGSQTCPACRAHVDVTTQNVWVLETRKPLPSDQQDDKGGLVELRKYKMDARLILKSHVPDGGFTCAICSQDESRDADAYCGSVAALITHIGRDHLREDFEREVDIWRE